MAPDVNPGDLKHGFDLARARLAAQRPEDPGEAWAVDMRMATSDLFG